MSDLFVPGGDPEAIRLLAAGLAARAERLDGVLAVSRALADGTGWDGPAAREVVARLDALRGDLAAVRRRWEGASGVLRDLADAFEAALVGYRAIATTYEATVAERGRFEDALRRLQLEVQPDVVAQVALGEGIADLLDTERACRTRWVEVTDAFRACEHRCAARLDALGDDVLTDHGAYGFLSGVETWARRGSLVTLTGRWFPVGEAVGWGLDLSATGLQTVRKVVWDEGDGADLALAWGGSIAGGFGAAAVEGARLSPWLLRTGSSLERLGAGGLLAGVERVGELSAAARRLRPETTLVPVTKLSSPVSLGTRVRTAVAARRSALGEAWRAAAWGGPQAQALLVAGWAAKAGGAAAEGVGTVRETTSRVQKEMATRRATVSPAAGTVGAAAAR